MHGQRLGAFAAFLEPGRAVAAGRPQSAALPAGVGIIDASVKALGVEAQRVGQAQHDHFAVLERDQTVVEVAGRYRHVLAEPERIVLIHPGVVARLGAVLADAVEPGPGILVDRPALRAMIAGRGRAVERAFAFRSVEAAEVPAAERNPDHAFGVDITTANAEIGFWHVVDLGKRGGRRVRAGVEPHHRGPAAEHADRAPDRAVDRARHHRVESGSAGDALVLGRIDGLVRLDVIVALAVAVGVQDERGPTLRLGGVAGLVEQFGVDPTDYRSAAA